MLFDVNEFDGFREVMLKSQVMGIVCLGHIMDVKEKDPRKAHRLEIYQSVPDLASHMSMIHEHLVASGNLDVFLHGVQKIEGKDE